MSKNSTWENEYLELRQLLHNQLVDIDRGITIHRALAADDHYRFQYMGQLETLSVSLQNAQDIIAGTNDDLQKFSTTGDEKNE